MEERQLVIGGFYKHFKDKLYQVRGIAYDSETREKMVVYQALYGDYSMYVRPYDMFMSPVDHHKYPEVTQKYRFTQVHMETEGSMDTSVKQAAEQQVVEQATESVKADEKEVAARIPAEEQYADISTEEGVIDGRLLRFLDAENYNEKLNVLTYLKSGLDDKIIDAMAASMDAEVPAGSIEDRYRSLRSVIMAHSKYECTRLRE